MFPVTSFQPNGSGIVREPFRSIHIHWRHIGDTATLTVMSAAGAPQFEPKREATLAVKEYVSAFPKRFECLPVISWSARSRAASQSRSDTILAFPAVKSVSAVKDVCLRSVSCTDRSTVHTTRSAVMPSCARQRVAADTFALGVACVERAFHLIEDAQLF